MTTEQIAEQDIYPSFDDELRALLPGKVVVPGDADWEVARTPWVVNVDQQPRAVVNVDGRRSTSSPSFGSPTTAGSPSPLSRAGTAAPAPSTTRSCCVRVASAASRSTSRPAWPASVPA